MVRFVLVIVTLLCVGAVSLRADDYDLIIRGGRVVDGTGNPAIFADVAVKDGRIAAIGRMQGGAPTVIDATGMVVTPGFIDVHTHAENLPRLPKAENFLRMGVTTLVTGNCGGSALDVGRFFARVEEAQPSVNIATLIGHNTVREEAMGGSFDRAPAAAELAKMRELVQAGMKDGAVGLSTGLIYLPGTFSKTDEILELAKEAAAFDGVYASHMRSEGAGIFDALNELFQIARGAKIRAEISHIKLSAKPLWGRADEVLRAIDKARDEGLEITHDQYAYTASSTSLGTLIPQSAREGGASRFRERIADPTEKARIVAEMKRALERANRTDYSYAYIASYGKQPALNGKNVVEAARLARGADSLDDQIELVLEIQKNGSAGAVFHGMHEDDLRAFLRHPNTMIASDSGERELGASVPHPRGYGNNARVLGQYVREQKVLRLEDAIRRMSSLPAQTFRLRDRGLLRTGYWADVTLFDPQKVTDPATFSDPHHYATGIRDVLVNGVPVIRDEKHTGAGPGRAVRHNARGND
ncbi:MAG: N-acyl-D-amino-acid deacylase family protein [Actinomycetota bacterium]